MQKRDTMARPKKKDGDKRKAVSFRLDGEAFQHLETAAQSNGHSLGAETERRLAALVGADEQTVQLLSSIAKEIAEIERTQRKGRWHKALTSWAAVAHMLRTGPIMLTRPEAAGDDEIVTAAYDAWQALVSERTKIIDTVAEIGITWTQQPFVPKGLGSGLFASGARPLDIRAAERKLIAALDDAEAEAVLIEKHDRVQELDREIEKAKDAWWQETAPYWEAEKEGQEWNRARQQRNAREAMEQGQPFDMAQLGGLDPWR